MATASGPLDHQSQFARIEVVEAGPRPLLQHVRINAFGLKQLDAALPVGPLLFEVTEFPVERGKLLIEILLGAKAMIAAIGIDREIRDHQRTACVEAERGQY